MIRPATLLIQLSRSLSAASLLVLMSFFSPPTLAAPYSDNGDGTVTDRATGLTWMRCSMGQTWADNTCTGTANTYTITQAAALTGSVTFAGHTDWRLPNVRELMMIADRSIYTPAIDVAAFPGAPAASYWSSSPTVGVLGYQWYVDFELGYVDYSNGEFLGYIQDKHARLVRSGQPFALLNPARLTSDYIDGGNGTVTHAPTGLTWKRCAEGQTWSGTTCTGVAITYTWDSAILLTSTFAGKSDWRLPTQDELLSLVDFTTGGSAVNQAMFPAWPSFGSGLSYFWSGELAPFDWTEIRVR